MKWRSRFVRQELRASGVVYHVLACGHWRPALYRQFSADEPAPWQHCPTCYRERRRRPVALVRCSPEDAHWLAGLLGALVHRGELEHPDAARRVALAARFAADNPIKEVPSAT